MVHTKLISILIVILGICLISISAWADDDAMMDVDNNRATYTGTWGYSTKKILYYGDNYRYAWGCGGGCSNAKPRQPL